MFVQSRGGARLLLLWLAVVGCGGSSRSDATNQGAGGQAAGGQAAGGQAAGGQGAGGSGAPSCEYDNTFYDVGASFPATDGCNTCSCGPGGVIQCTERGCTTCADISAAYSRDSDAARACDPALSVEQCTKLTSYGLECECEGFTNPAHDRAESLSSIKQQWDAMGCDGPATCLCLRPTYGRCSPEGMCQDFFDEPTSNGGQGGEGNAGGTGGGGGVGVAGDDGVGGEGSALTECPKERRPAVGEACAGSFQCNYDDTCRCGTCCYSSYACSNAAITFLGANDACFNVPC